MRTTLTKQKNFLLSLAVMAAIVFSACSEEKQETARSMEQIRNEDGVPVKVEKPVKKEFVKSMTFYAQLSGIRQTPVMGMVNDKIAKINAKVGDFVKEDQVVIEFPTDNPALQFDQAKAALDIAEKTYNRMKALLEAGETSQQNFDQAETQYLVNKRNYEQLNQLLNVESPISGTVVEMKHKVGDIVGQGKPLFTVAQLGQMKAKIWASEEEAAFIKNGMSSFILIDKDTLRGRVSEVTLTMDKDKRAFGVEILFPNPSRMLKSGVMTDIYINTYTNPETFVLKRHLINKDEKGKFVYVDLKGNAVKQYVKTGQESGVEIEITDGLDGSEMIITQGQALVEEGKKISVVE